MITRAIGCAGPRESGYPDEIATAGNSYLWIEALNSGAQ
jgi:hypothetical protein